MGKKWIKFLKDYDEHKKDAVVQVDGAIADSLVNLKFAELTDSPEGEIVNKAIEELGGSIKELVTSGISEGIAVLSKDIKAKIPAVPRDHEEEGRRGFKTSSEFFRTLVKNPGDKRLAFVNDEMEQKGTPSGLNTRDDVAGGYLVPETYAAEVWEHVIATSIIFGDTDRRQTGGNSLTINGIEETSRKDGFRDGGMLAYWMAEADQYTATNPRFTRRRLELHKLGVLAYVTDEEMEDSNVTLGPVLTRKSANAINFKMNESFIWGSGVGKPLGVMNSNALIVAKLVTNQGNNSILHQNINHMYHLMRPELRPGAKWYVHPNLAEQLEYIAFLDVIALGTSTVPIPIYLPPGGLSASPYGTLKGLPVIPLEYMRDLGSEGDILFANFSQYATLTKDGGGIKSAVSMHVRFLYDEQAFKWTFRIDGQSLWPSALEDYNGSTKRSPFVTLASRATVSSSSGL